MKIHKCKEMPDTIKYRKKLKGIVISEIELPSYIFNKKYCTWCGKNLEVEKK